MILIVTRKIDKNLTTIWDKTYMNTSTISYFYNAIEKENGNILVHGGHKNSYNLVNTEIMELNSQGDSLWSQQLIGNTDSTTSYAYAENAKLTSDNGLILTGYITDNTLTPTQQMWLIKTNQYGYDGSEWTIDTVFTGINQIATKKESGIKIWPNPAKNTLYVQYNPGYKQSKTRTTNNSK